MYRSSMTNQFRNSSISINGSTGAVCCSLNFLKCFLDLQCDLRECKSSGFAVIDEQHKVQMRCFLAACLLNGNPRSNCGGSGSKSWCFKMCSSIEDPLRPIDPAHCSHHNPCWICRKIDLLSTIVPTIVTRMVAQWKRHNKLVLLLCEIGILLQQPYLSSIEVNRFF